VRVVGIADTAVEMPPRAPRMAYSERTAEDENFYTVASMIERRAF